MAVPYSSAINEHLLNELLRASQYAAKDICLVQGSGGNASVKSADTLWIKASGLTMGDVGHVSGYVAVHLSLVREMLGSRCWNPELLVSGNRLLPSMETGFHALLGPVVLHTHPIYVNAFACMQRGKEALREIHPEAALWVEYCPPGVELAISVRDALTQRRQTDPIVLANHGFIANGKTADEAISTTERFIAAGKKFFGDLPSDCLGCLAPADTLLKWIADLQSALDRYLPEDSRVIMPARWAVLNQRDAEWFQTHALFPDQVVWRPEAIFHVATNCPAEAWLRDLDSLPQRSVLTIEGAGLLFIGENRRVTDAMEENLLAAVLIRDLISRRGRVQELTAADVDFLRNMEAEKYRQTMAALEGKR
jgi:rhamnose utilization protein RhaD (predicted bifunctional aldolase and dehydrogenase)